MKCTLLHSSHKMPMQIGMADYRFEISMICSQQHRASRCGEFPQLMLRRVRPTAGNQQRRKR
jgi:hypothetical protein